MVRKVYLDSNVFISAVSSLGQSGENARKIIKNIEKGVYAAFTAILTIDEILWVLQRLKDKKSALQAARIVFNMPNLTMIDVDKNVVEKAFEMYEKYDLKPRDAIHLAAANLKEIKTIISSDADFDKIKGINRIDFSK